MLKKLCAIILSITLIHSLTGCSGSGGTVNQKGPEFELTFPGTHWGMTPDELIAELGLKEGTFQAEFNDTRYAIQIEEYEVFRFPAEVTFRFLNENGDGEYGLSAVYVFFADNADMESVQQMMIATYGETTPLGDQYSYEEQKQLCKWCSEAVQADCLTQSQLDALQKAYDEVSDGTQTMDLYENPLTVVYWSTNAGILITGSADNWTGPVNGLKFVSVLTELRETYGE